MFFYDPYQEKSRERREIKFKGFLDRFYFLIGNLQLESDSKKYNFNGRDFGERLDLFIYSFFPSYEKIMDLPKTPREKWHVGIRKQPVDYSKYKQDENYRPRPEDLEEKALLWKRDR